MKKPAFASGAAALTLVLAAAHAEADSAPDTDRLPADEQVQITATRGSRLAFDTPQAVTVITRQMLADSNAGTTPDALAGSPGILIQKSNTGGGAPFIRGLTGKQVLILVDGVRVNNSYYRFGPHQYLNTIDAGDIQRIEVVHGPSSVLYGSDALGGLINIVTRAGSGADGGPARSSPSALIALRGATADGSAAGRAQFELAQSDFGLQLSLGAKHFGDLRGGAGVGKQVPTAYDEGNAQFKLRYRLAENQELVFLQHLLRQSDVPKTNEVVLGTKAQFNYEPQFDALSYLAYNARPADWALFDAVKLVLSYHRQKEGEDIIERATPTIETRELTDIATPGLTGQFTKSLNPALKFTYGFEHHADRYATRKQRLDLSAAVTSDLTPGTPNGATYSSTGVYGQAEINIGQVLQLIPGVRYARFKADGDIQGRKLQLEAGKGTASMSGLVRLSPHWHAVASVAQGYRAPNMEDFFGRVDFSTEIPNTDLRPESSLNREIGLKFHTPQTSASVHYFHARYSDLIARATVAPGVRQRQNLRAATIDGFEAQLAHAFDGGITARAALARTQGVDKATGNPLQRIPPVNGSAHLRYTASPQLWCQLSALFAARQDRLSPEDLTDLRIPAGGTPGYGILNLGLGYRPGATQELTLTLENTTNRKYKTHGSGVYAPGANFIVGYSIRL
jgi:outer membrane receptor protein involved in Fe transport